MNDTSNRRLNRNEAAEFLTENGFNIRPGTLAKYASVGGGPVYQKFGRAVSYCAPDLLAWARDRSSGPITLASEAHEAD